MMARGHRLMVGKQGIVGYVTGIGLPRVSQDTALDRIHSTAPELPDTRSEMALPLKARDEIIGALHRLTAGNVERSGHVAGGVLGFGAHIEEIVHIALCSH